MIGKNGRSSWEWQGITAFCTCQWNEWMNILCVCVFVWKRERVDELNIFFRSRSAPFEIEDLLLCFKKFHVPPRWWFFVPLMRKVRNDENNTDSLFQTNFQYIFFSYQQIGTRAKYMLCARFITLFSLNNGYLHIYWGTQWITVLCVNSGNHLNNPLRSRTENHCICIYVYRSNYHSIYV